MISTALQMLYDEHDSILLALDRLEKLLSSVPPARESDVQDLIEFFRGYADGYHHAKEEHILFPRLVRANASLESLTASLDDHHQQFRQQLAGATTALQAGERASAYATLAQFCSDLRDHIAAEDDELFVVAEEVLSEKEKEEIAFLFLDSDRSRGLEAKQRMEHHAVGL